ncbi:MAG TPA: hypothetical protein VJA94_00730 [Candidatus Angelobacter sp.]
MSIASVDGEMSHPLRLETLPSRKVNFHVLSLLLFLSFVERVYAIQSETIDGIYRGTLGKEQIVLEMGVRHVRESGGQDHIVLVGRYFIPRFGGTTELKGDRLQDGSIDLKEHGPYSFSGNEFRLIVVGEQAVGSFWEYDVRPEARPTKQFAVSLTRISRGFDPDLPRGPVSASPADRVYYDLILQFLLKRGREIRVDKQTAYVMQGDARFPGRMPLLTRLPNSRVMAKVNAVLVEELNQRRLLDSGCIMGRRFDHQWDEKNSVTFIGRDILSVVRETRRHCGSNESWVEVLNYDLQTGNQLDLNNLFHMQRQGPELTRQEELPNEAPFLPLVDLYVKYAIALDDECKKIVSRASFMEGPLGLRVYFTREGMVLSPVLYGENRRCADDEIIPYPELRGLINTDSPFKSLLGLIRTRSRVSSLVYVARSLQLVHEGEFSGQDVIPPRVRILQARLKHRLRDLIEGLLNQPGMENKTPREIRRTILRRLRHLGIFEGFKEYGPDYSYGHVLDVSVDMVSQRSDMLAIGLIVDVNWDQDQSMYIFRQQSGRWVNVLAAEVNGYPEVWDAQSSRFNYAVSPPASDGSWFLVTSSVNPHKASAWQHVTYTAWAPGIDGDHPHILVRRTHTIYLAGSDDESHACRIKVRRDGFYVSFVIGFGDYSPADERYIDEYRVTAQGAKRMAVRCRTRNIMGRRVDCSSRQF